MAGQTILKLYKNNILLTAPLMVWVKQVRATIDVNLN
jgi:hypothetical protein